MIFVVSFELLYSVMITVYLLDKSLRDLYYTRINMECIYLQLAVDFLFCLVLIEILKQLNFHPGYDDLIDKIIQMSFSHFKLNDR